MGKFDGILLCSDLDDTLLTTDKRVSKENVDAIEYFKSEGGLFTFATGRIPYGAKIMTEYVKPNAPMVCCNGAGIYDFEREEMIWSLELDKGAIDVVEFIDKNYPFSGIEVIDKKDLYFCKMNDIVKKHKEHEKLPELYADYHDIKPPWTKVLFMQKREEVNIVKQALLNSEFVQNYDFVQSSPNYYELLPKNASKGNAAIKLAEILGINKNMIIGVGDNENDISLIEKSGVGIAVSNAVDDVLKIADYVTVDNNKSAISAIIKAIENGEIKLI